MRGLPLERVQKIVDGLPKGKAQNPLAVAPEAHAAQPAGQRPSDGKPQPSNNEALNRAMGLAPHNVGVRDRGHTMQLGAELN